MQQFLWETSNLWLQTSSGMSQWSALSRRPGLRRAGSMRSGREVAAKMYTPSKPSTPSSWVSSWLTTRSVTPVLSCPLLKDSWYHKTDSHSVSQMESTDFSHTGKLMKGIAVTHWMEKYRETVPRCPSSRRMKWNAIRLVFIQHKGTFIQHWNEAHKMNKSIIYFVKLKSRKVA